MHAARVVSARRHDPYEKIRQLPLSIFSKEWQGITDDGMRWLDTADILNRQNPYSHIYTTKLHHDIFSRPEDTLRTAIIDFLSDNVGWHVPGLRIEIKSRAGIITAIGIPDTALAHIEKYISENAPTSGPPCNRGFAR